jgi:Phage integrase family.
MAKRIYRTAWFFVEHKNLDKTIYDILESYLNQGKYSRFQELWAKYFAVCYLGGFRRVEPFLSKVAIDKEEDNGMKYYHLVKTNAKHFKSIRIVNDHKVYGERDRIPLLFTPANKYEAAMWEFVAPHQREIIDFTPLLGGILSRQSLADISRKFSMRFRAKITNGQITEQNGGVTPHMLRHARTYDLHIIEGYPDYVVMKIMGWDNRDMIDFYEDIKAALNIKELKEVYIKRREAQRSAAPEGSILNSVYFPEPAL